LVDFIIANKGFIIYNIIHMNNITISTKKIRLNKHLKEICQSKSDKLFNHSNNIISLNIELEKDPHSSTHESEFLAKGHLLTKGKSTNLKASSDNIYKSIDLLIHKLDRSLRRHNRLAKVKRKQDLNK